MYSGVSASFLIGYSWLPSFLVANTGIDARITLWMVLSCMMVFTVMVPVAGLLSDKGMPRLTSTIIFALVSAATAVPTDLYGKGNGGWVNYNRWDSSQNAASGYGATRWGS